MEFCTEILRELLFWFCKVISSKLSPAIIAEKLIFEQRQQQQYRFPLPQRITVESIVSMIYHSTRGSRGFQPLLGTGLERALSSL